MCYYKYLVTYRRKAFDHFETRYHKTLDSRSSFIFNPSGQKGSMHEILMGKALRHTNHQNFRLIYKGND